MSIRELSRDEKIFLQRVALTMLETNQELTPENMDAAMRRTMAREWELEECLKRHRPAFEDFARGVYDSIREKV